MKRINYVFSVVAAVMGNKNKVKYFEKFKDNSQFKEGLGLNFRYFYRFKESKGKENIEEEL